MLAVEVMNDEVTSGAFQGGHRSFGGVVERFDRASPYEVPALTVSAMNSKHVLSVTSLIP